MSYSKEKEVALYAVKVASKLCQRVQSNIVQSDALSKSDKSPVTIADFGAQAIVNHFLKESFSDDPIVGEEDSGSLREPENAELLSKVIDQVFIDVPEIDCVLEAIDYGNAEPTNCQRFWTLDPIDGTKGFLRGDQYAIALGLIENGKVVMGALGCPNLVYDLNDPNSPKGCIFIADKDSQTIKYSMDLSLNEVVKVDTISNPTEAVFCESVESGHTAHGRSAQIAKMLNVEAEPFRIDSQCKYAAVGRGDASIYMRLPTIKGYQEKIWDHAGGSIVIEQAGGKVTDINGKDLDFSCGKTLAKNSGVIATNGLLHDLVIATIAKTE